MRRTKVHMRAAGGQLLLVHSARVHVRAPSTEVLSLLSYVCVPQLSEAVKSYLQQAEEEFRAAKEEQRHALWDDKMRATQTQSAFGVRVT